MLFTKNPHASRDIFNKCKGSRNKCVNFEKNKPKGHFKSIVTSCGNFMKEGLKEVSVSEAHVENLTKNGDKYTITKRVL